MSEEITNTVTIQEPETPVVQQKTEVVTREQLKEKGWSKKELDAAEKRGMIEKSEKQVDPNKNGSDPDTSSQNEKKEATPSPEKRATEEKKSTLPDFEFKTPEQEKAFMDAFGPGTPQRAMYFRMKNERQTRQNAEAERDRLALELQLLKDQKLNLSDSVVETDENGNQIDPEDKPLTMKQLKAMQKAEMEELNKQQQELHNRSQRVAESMKNQEEYAKSIIPDFDDTVRLAADLVQNIDVLVPEKWKQEKIKKLIKDLQVTAATADKYGVDDYNAPMISYELGQLHPRYGQKAETDGSHKADPKANGSLTPEQMKRIEENTQRRASSASLPGSSGGRRVVSVDDLTIKDILKMSPEERYKFKKDHPEKMQKLMRG